MIALAVVLAVAAFNLWITPSNPPGFLPDEASMSYNAYRLAHHLRDENGAVLPLYLSSFGDYKSPLFVYTLAAVFRVTGPHSEVARGLAAVGILAAVLLLGFLAYRQTAKRLVGLVVVVLAGLTPWLFEVGRAAYEVALEPLVICLFLLAVDATWRKQAWTWPRGVSVGLGLTGIAYVYAAGRLLAPLFALALLMFVRRSRWRWFAAAWGTIVATAVIPIAVYWVRHPGALTERYSQTSFITGSMKPWTIVGHAVANYVHDVNLWHWVVSGDPKPYVHTYGSGSIFASVVLLGLASVALAVVRGSDTFWRFTVLLLVLAPIPAALTKDRYYGLRLVPLPVLLIVVAIPAIALLSSAVRTSWLARLAAAALSGIVAFQFVHFVDNFRYRGPARTLAFHAGVPGLLKQGLAEVGTIWVNHDEPHALVYAKWYAVEHGISLTRVRHIPRGSIVTPGTVVFGRFQPCEFVCKKFATADDYYLAHAAPPTNDQRPQTGKPSKPTITTAPGSGLRITFLAEGQSATAGAAWAYYLRVTRHGKAWRGAIVAEVRTRAGKTIDRIGQFPFKGSRLAGYLWATEDRGQILEFTINLVQDGTSVGSITYPVYVQYVYAR